jgi:phage tail-like protein
MAYFSREKLGGLTGTKGDFNLATHFTVEIAGKGVMGGIFQVTGLENESDVVEYRDSDHSVSNMMSRPGNAKTGNVQFVRHFGNTKNFVDWFEETRAGKVARTSATITFLGDNDSLQSQIHLFEIWPYAYQIDGFDSKSSALLTETISCKYETIKYG